MSTKQAVEKTTMMDKVMLTISILLIIAGIWANEYYITVDLSLRLIAWLVLLIVAGFIALQSRPGRAFWQFLRSARMELRRVVWPTRQETVQTTMIVVGLVILLGLIIWGIDTALLHIMGWLVGQRG